MKVAAISLAAGLVYLAQLRYERDLKHAEIQDRLGNGDDGFSGEYRLLRQIEFAGASKEEKLRQLEKIAPTIGASPFTRDITTIRGIVCVSIPMKSPIFFLDSSNPSPYEPPGWSFMLVDDKGHETRSFPVSTSDKGILCVCIPYSNPEGIHEPKMRLIHGKKVVCDLRLAQLPALINRFKTVGTRSGLLSVEALDISRIRPFANIDVGERDQSWLPPRTGYRVHLSRALSADEVAFVRLKGTDFVNAESNTDWTEIKNSEALIASPCGFLAKYAALEVIVGKRKSEHKRVSALLGNVETKFGQPNFIQSRDVRLPVTPNIVLSIPKQGFEIHRPSAHVKRSITIKLGIYNQLGKESSGVPERANGITWVSPLPDAFGLESISLPWRRVMARSRVRRLPLAGPVFAQLDVGYTSIIPFKNTRELVPIANIKVAH